MIVVPLSRAEPIGAESTMAVIHMVVQRARDFAMSVIYCPDTPEGEAPSDEDIL